MKVALAIWGVVTVVSVAVDLLWSRKAPTRRAEPIDRDDRGVLLHPLERERFDR